MTTDSPSHRRGRAAQVIAPLVGIVATVAAAVAIGHGVGHSHGARARVLGVRVEGNAGCGLGNGGGTRADCADSKALTLTGSVAGRLAPGATRTLSVVVTNDNSQPVQVLRISASVNAPTGGSGDGHLPACTAAWVDVGGYTYTNGPQVIAPAHGTVTVPLGIQLTNQPLNQDNCKSATFTVGLAGEGSQVH